MRSWAAAGACAVVALSAGCAPTSQPAPAGKTLRIGVDLPLSGGESRAATPALNGIRYFVQTHPTLDGFTIQLETTDDAADPKRGVSNVNRFLTEAGVVAMIGPFDGPVARKEIPVANSAGLAMVSPATSNPCLTRDVYVPAPIVDATSAPAAQAAIAGFKTSFGSTSAYGPYTMVAYDATAVLYAALDRAIVAAGGGLPSRDQVIAELARTSGLEGVTGRLGFDANGDTTNRVVSIFEAPAAGARAPWKLAGTVDYSARLPY